MDTSNKKTNEKAAPARIAAAGRKKRRRAKGFVRTLNERWPKAAQEASGGMRRVPRPGAQR
jgi:hypothetical protein